MISRSPFDGLLQLSFCVTFFSWVCQLLFWINNLSRRIITASNDHFIFSVYKNCAEVYKSGAKISGVNKICPGGLGEFEVFCDQKTAGGGWTVFQKRRDGSVDFFRAWDDYKRGFGNLNGEFWIGLDKIHRLTVSGGYKLRVDLEDIHGKTAFAEYSSFSVRNETAKYQLNLGSYSGKFMQDWKRISWRKMLLIGKYNDKKKERKKIRFFFLPNWARLEFGSHQLIFVTTIDLICNVILDHIKKSFKRIGPRLESSEIKGMSLIIKQLQDLYRFRSFTKCLLPLMFL